MTDDDSFTYGEGVGSVTNTGYFDGEPDVEFVDVSKDSVYETDDGIHFILSFIFRERSNGVRHVKQTEIILPRLDIHDSLMERPYKGSRGSIIDVLEEVEQELDPIMTKDKTERLEEKVQEMKEIIREDTQ